jgi:PAS domain S-box-containing protein
MKTGAIEGWSEERLLDTLVAGTSGETGLPFFRALVSGLCDALGTDGAWVAEYRSRDRTLRAIACRFDGAWVEDYEYPVSGTPCGECIARRDMMVVADRVADLFPGDNDLGSIGAAGYIGIPFFDESGENVLGHLAVLDRKPIADPERFSRVFRIFANRAGAELRRSNLERELRERTEELDTIVSTALDAILIVDAEHTICCANPAAEEAFGTRAMVGQLIDRFLSVQGAVVLDPILSEMLAATCESGAQRWIASGVNARTAQGLEFPVEGTLSRFELKGAPFATLILRNVSDRLAAEARMRDLANQSDYLREEVERAYGEIIGESRPMRHLIAEIERVASTDVSVLITGETGTGKELVARAVHRGSRRAKAPLIKVNCAALPEHLIESEFFGHEKGAFTGAIARREGRFALADKGTLFLDEVGELPLGLQAKLLRVLQEGEFEPVGGSRTIKVDVRVIAATNRDLKTEVAAGRFREDLYYRLSVFPLESPPLRSRGDDIDRLATAFVRQFCTRYGREAVVVMPSDLERLRAYDWPGNVRELSNVIERAIITGDGFRLNMDRALPPANVPVPPATADASQSASTRILTDREMSALQRENLQRALLAANGKISGPAGAAVLLGVKPTTLRSRMAAFGLTGGSEGAA